MIENDRDEDACRQMDAFANEDHTHHLTSQEYFYFKSYWWLRSNKTGSDSVPVHRRSDLNKHCPPCRNSKRSSQKSTMGTEFFFFSTVELARFLVDFFPMKVTMEMNQVLTEQGVLLYNYWEQFFKALFS